MRSDVLDAAPTTRRHGGRVMRWLAPLLAAVALLSLAAAPAWADSSSCPNGQYGCVSTYSYPDGSATGVRFHRHVANGSSLTVEAIDGVFSYRGTPTSASIFAYSNGTKVYENPAFFSTSGGYTTVYGQPAANSVIIAHNTSSYVGWQACFSGGGCIRHTLDPTHW